MMNFFVYLINYENLLGCQFIRMCIREKYPLSVLMVYQALLQATERRIETFFLKKDLNISL